MRVGNGWQVKSMTHSPPRIVVSIARNPLSCSLCSDEMASELETLRRASLRAEEEVAHAVAEVREEARAEMDAAEERHRKLLERLERHTRQALKVRGIGNCGRGERGTRGKLLERLERHTATSLQLHRMFVSMSVWVCKCAW